MSGHYLADRLRELACKPGLPWTADDASVDHGHTDCWLLHLAADELDRMADQITHNTPNTQEQHPT